MNKIYDVSNWTSVKKLITTQGNIYGLKENGNVLNSRKIYCGGINTSELIQIVSVYEFKECVIGLKRNGTVVVDESENIQNVILMVEII